MKRMTNILVEGYSHIPSYDLTVRDFERYGQLLPIVVKSKLTMQITPEDIQWCDILVCVRGNNTLSEYLAKQAVKAGRKVILTIDDDLIDYESRPHKYIDRLYSDSVKSILECSHYILTTSKYLGEKYKKEYGKKYTLVDTIVEKAELYPIMKREVKDIVKIVYAAGPAHIVFFNEYIAPILNKLYERYHDRIMLTIVGPDIDLSGVKLAVEKVPSMPLVQYQQYMSEQRFDIGLAPLTDSEFCRSKYFNKYIEYAKYGICGIFSNIMPYTIVVNNGKNGILADNTPEAWFHAICHVIDNIELQYSCTVNAQEQLLSNHSLEKITSSLVRDIPDLIKYKAEKCKKAPFRFLYQRYLLLAIRRKIQVLINE